MQIVLSTDSQAARKCPINIVCIGMRETQRPAFISASSLFIMSSAPAFLLFLFLLIHNFNVTQTRGVCWHSTLHYAIQGCFYCRKFNMRFDVFIFASAAKILLSVNLWILNILKSATALKIPEGCFSFFNALYTLNKHAHQPYQTPSGGLGQLNLS